MANYTRDTPKEVQLPVRLPLVGVLNQRSDSGGIDSRLINGYVEKGQDGEIRVTKRQGYSLYDTFSGNGSGLLQTTSALYSVFGTSLYQDSVLAGTDTLLGAGALSHLLEVSTGASSRAIIINNGLALHYWDGTTFKRIPFQGETAGPLTASITSGSAVVALASTAALSKYSDVTGTGIAANTTIASIDSSTQITLSLAATATNASAALSFVLAGPPFIVASGLFQPQLVPRSQILNRSLYVMSLSGKIAGADPDDPLAWNPLNQIIAYATLTNATQFARQLTYLIAFKQDGYEFFRDEGNSPGSPLARVEGLQGDVGCFGGHTLQEIDDKIIWISTSRVADPGVWMLTGGKLREVSTPAIRRLLPAYLDGDLTTYAFPMEGHLFYVIASYNRLDALPFSLVYDVTSDFWSYWRTSASDGLPFVAAAVAASPARALLQHETNGKIYELDVANVTDVGSTFDMDIYPPEFDANMLTSKYLSKMYVSGDQQTGSILKVRVNDNNQQPGSWTNWREFDLSSARPRIDECGSFYKRSFHFRHSSATRCRIEAVEMDLQPGTL